MTNPNPFSPAERAFIRDIMCVPRLNISANSEFENVMDSIDGLYDSTDAGATQARIRTYMAEITVIDTQINQASFLMLATEVEDEVKFDAIRNIEGLRDYGRQLCGRVSRQMGLLPRDDYFAAAPISPPGNDYLDKSNYEHLIKGMFKAGRYIGTSRHR